MSSGLSEKGGLGLGTLGFHREVAERMTKEAGFGGFEELDWESHMNSCEWGGCGGWGGGGWGLLVQGGVGGRWVVSC